MTQTKKSSLNEKLGFALLASLTLGLAPFFPEPHVWGKLKWVAGGAVGMKALDWFDLVMHGAPFLALIYFVIVWLWTRFRA